MDMKKRTLRSKEYLCEFGGQSAYLICLSHVERQQHELKRQESVDYRSLRHEIDSFIKLLKDNSIEVRKRAKRMEERLDAVKKIFEA